MPLDVIHSNAGKYSNTFSKKTTEFTLYFWVNLRKCKYEALGYKLLDATGTASWSLPSRCLDPEPAGQLWPEDLRPLPSAHLLRGAPSRISCMTALRRSGAAGGTQTGPSEGSSRGSRGQRLALPPPGQAVGGRVTADLSQPALQAARGLQVWRQLSDLWGWGGEPLLFQSEHQSTFSLGQQNTLHFHYQQERPLPSRGSSILCHRSLRATLGPWKHPTDPPSTQLAPCGQLSLPPLGLLCAPVSSSVVGTR